MLGAEDLEMFSIPYVHIKRSYHDTGAAQQVELGHEVQHTLHVMLMTSPGFSNLQDNE